MSGTGTTIVDAAATLSITGGDPHRLYRTLRNDGTATWTSGDLRITGATLLNNGTFTASAAGTLSGYSESAAGTFANAGTFIKQGAGTIRNAERISLCCLFASSSFDRNSISTSPNRRCCQPLPSPE